MKILGITLGDCAGISPEIILKALPAIQAESPETRFVIYGSQAVLGAVAKRLDLPVPECAFAPLPDPFADALPEPGRVQPLCGEWARRWVRQAAFDALAGKIDAVVTAPLNKAATHLAGHHEPGHTEMLADCAFEATGVRAEPCMAFWSPGLILSLATIHLPLAEVPRALTIPGLARTLALTDAFARQMTGQQSPRTGVLALNPHAGEGGLFGDEEASIIQPAMREVQAKTTGRIEGPLVADTAFTWLLRGKAPYDAYVAMYHDQGLIPFKALAFDSGVNVTLGLPLIRTSPDHGTAFDIAWQGAASPESMADAIRCALRLIGGGHV